MRTHGERGVRVLEQSEVIELGHGSRESRVARRERGFDQFKVRALLCITVDVAAVERLEGIYREQLAHERTGR